MNKIEIFSKSGCGGCDRVKEYFNTEGIQYTVLDIKEQPEYRDELLELGFMSLPVIRVGDRCLGSSNIEEVMAFIGE